MSAGGFFCACAVAAICIATAVVFSQTMNMYETNAAALKKQSELDPELEPELEPETETETETELGTEMDTETESETQIETEMKQKQR